MIDDINLGVLRHDFMLLKSKTNARVTSVHAIIESWNHRIIDWKRPLRSSSPTINPTLPCLLNHITKCHVYTFFEHLQGWGLHPLPGQPVPMPDRSFSKEIFPSIQSKPPLTQLEDIKIWNASRTAVPDSSSRVLVG